MGFSRQYGFSLIELMTVLLLTSILAMLALPAYLDYRERARVTSGIYLAGTAKLAVSEYISVDNAYPDSNEAAGLAEPQEISSQDIQSVSVSRIPAPGTIPIVYKASSSIKEGDTVLLIPANNGGSVSWNCISNLQELLPASCRI